MKCPECGIEVGEFPEDAKYEETLCNLCSEEMEGSDVFLGNAFLSETDKVSCPDGQRVR